MNHHFGNVGDVMKHLALVHVAGALRPARYLESHAGAFDYALSTRGEPLPDGVWDFLSAASSVRALDESGYAAILRPAAGSPPQPGVYPGSVRFVWEALGSTPDYVLNDTDAKSADDIAQALGARRATPRLSRCDGIDMVLDEAAPGDLVLIDPFEPDVMSPVHRATAIDAFANLVRRGVTVILWRALHGDIASVDVVHPSELTVRLRLAERTGSMDGCELVLGNVGPDIAADVARLATAHGSILANGEIHIDVGASARADAEEARSPERTIATRQRLFDRYVMIDWSAKNSASPLTPTQDAIWIGDLSAEGQGEIYCPTREVAFEETQAILGDAVGKGQRVLIGFDFPFGYPRGFAAAVGLNTEAPWKSVWLDLAERITDDAKNANNRFEVARSFNERTGPAPGPFWGCPDAHDFGVLTKKSKGLLSFPYKVPGGQLEKFRATEVLIPGTVQETWRLLGVGSVGSQALVGINRVAKLRFDPRFGAISQVWPFETGLTAPDLPQGTAAIVFAEIWPGIVDTGRLNALMLEGLVKDEAQVRLMCEWAFEHDEAGRLGQYLAPPQALDGHADAVVSEEGWILGCL